MMVVQTADLTAALSGPLMVGNLVALKAASMDAPMVVLTVEARADLSVADSAVRLAALWGSWKVEHLAVPLVASMAVMLVVHWVDLRADWTVVQKAVLKVASTDNQMAGS